MCIFLQILESYFTTGHLERGLNLFERNIETLEDSNEDLKILISQLGLRGAGFAVWGRVWAVWAHGVSVWDLIFQGLIMACDVLQNLMSCVR